MNDEMIKDRSMRQIRDRQRQREKGQILEGNYLTNKVHMEHENNNNKK